MSIIREKKLTVTVTDNRDGDESSRDLSIASETYNSLNDFISDLRSRSYRFDKYQMKKRDDNNHHNYLSSNLNSYEEMIELMKKGYSQMMENLKGVTKECSAKTPKLSFGSGVSGFTPIVSNALMGLPNSMVNTKTNNTGKVLDIYYANDMCGSYGASDFLNAGEKLLRTLIELEKQGYRFNLYSCAFFVDSKMLSPFTSPTYRIDALAVKVKSSDKPLNLNKISFPLSHPGWCRVTCFDWQGLSPVTRDMGEGRGSTLHQKFNDKFRLTIIRAIYGARAIYLGAEDILNKTQDDIIDEIKTWSESLFGNKSKEFSFEIKPTAQESTSNNSRPTLSWSHLGSVYEPTSSGSLFDIPSPSYLEARLREEALKRMRELMRSRGI